VYIAVVQPDPALTELSKMPVTKRQMEVYRDLILNHCGTAERIMKKRRLLRTATCAVGVIMVLFALIHTPPLRRAALARFTAYLSKSQGIIIHTESFNYNLLSLRFSLERVSLRYSSPAGLPDFLTAGRIRFRLRFRDLMHGILKAQSVEIEGLRLNAVVRKDEGANTIRNPQKTPERGRMRLPFDALEISDLFLFFKDEQTGFSIELSDGTVKGSGQEIEYSLLKRGKICWGGKEMPVENLTIKVLLQNDGIFLQSLHMIGEGIEIESHGKLQDLSLPQLNFTVHVEAQGSSISSWLRLKEVLAGRIQATVKISGTLQQLTAEGELHGSDVRFGGSQLDSFAAKGRFESSTGILELREVTARMNAGQIRADGELSLLGQARSTVHVEAHVPDLRRIGASLGWHAPPRGEASAALTLSCPGNHWNNASFDSRVIVVMHPSAGIRPVPGITARFTGRLSEDQVHVKIESVSGYDANLHGFLDVSRRDMTASGELRGGIGSLAQLIRNLERSFGKPADSMLPFPIDGRIEWRAVVSGSLSHPLASIDIEGTDMSASRIAGGTLRLQGDYAPDRFLLRQARLDWHGQSLTAWGEIGLASDSSPLHIESDIEQVAIAEFLGSLRGSDILGTASARVRVAGTRADPKMDIRAEVQGVEAYGELLGHLEMEAEWKAQSFALNRLRLEKPQQNGNGTLEAHGEVDFRSNEYHFNLEGENLQAANLRWSRGVPVTGALHLKAIGEGNLGNPAIRVDAEWKDLRIANETLGDVSGVLQLSDHKGRLTVENAARGIEAIADFATEGTYPVRLDFKTAEFSYAFKAIGGRVATITSAAVVQGEGSLRPAEIREASALLKGLALEIGGKKIRSDGPLELGYSGRRVRLRPARFETEDIQLNASGEMPLDSNGEPGKLSLTGDIGLNSAISLFSSEGAINADGKLILNAEIRGSLRSFDPSATLTIEGGLLKSPAIPAALEEINAVVKLIDRRIKIEPVSAKVGSGAIRGMAEIPIECITGASKAQESAAALPARFSVEAENVPFLPTAQGQAGGIFSGRIKGETPAADLKALAAQLDLTEVSLYSNRFSIKQAEPVVIKIDDGQLRFGRWRWTGPQGELQLYGTVGLTGEYPLDVHISGNADATLCSVLIPSASCNGSLRIDLTGLGTLGDPLLSGILEIEKGSIGIQQPRIVAEDLNLKIELDKGRGDVRKLEGLLNGGRILGSGSALFRGRKLADVNIDLSGQNIFLEAPKGVRSASDLRLQIRGGDSGIVIAGEVAVREGSYVEPFDFSGTSSANLNREIQSGKQTQGPGSKIRYDIKAKTLQPFEINNNLARLSARADIRLVGDSGSPGMLGMVTLDRGGKIYFGSRVYYAERGVVTFANEARIDPVYDLVATTQVNDYLISLRLSGTGSKIAATFTSDPPLSQNDIIGVLLTGKPSSESGGSRVDPAQAERLSLVTGVLNADLSARMRRRFGISQVTIQPGLISEESDPGARLTIGQDLSQSLRFVYSMNLVNSADQVWYAEYDLRRRFTARAVMQNDNTYRTDFRQDFRFGGRKTGLSEMSHSARKLRIGNVEFNGNAIFDTASLARRFKVAPGDKFDFSKSRKGIERVQESYAKQDFLAARINVDREDQNQRIDLIVRIEEGQRVKINYAGAKLPKPIQKRVRKIWQEGIADTQRSDDARQALLDHFAKRGYPQAKIAVRIDRAPSDEKSVRFEIQTGVHYKRVEAAFEGSAPEHAALIAARLKNRKIADKVSSRPAAAMEEAAAYYRQKGYLLAKISTPRLEPDANGKAAKIIFHVNEGLQIRIRMLQFQGNRALDTAELKRDLPLREGEVLGPDQIKNTAAVLAEKYGKKGYRNPKIDFKTLLDEKRGLADLTFAIQEGVASIIESVKVEGQERISEKFVRQQLRITEGEPQDFPETIRSINKLYDTGAFSNVDIESKPRSNSPAGDSGMEKVDVTVKVQEVPPFKFLYGGYYDSDRGPGGIIEVENRNWLGGARVMGLRTRYDSALQEGRMYFSQPLWRGHARPTTGTIYYRREKDYYEGLSAEKAGFTLQQEITLRKKLVASYGYRFESVYSWYPDHHALNPPRAIVAPVTLSLTRSTRNDFLDPTNGSFMSVAVELGPKILGSTYGHTRLFSQYFKYFPLQKPGHVPFQEEVKKPRFVYATGLRLGLIRGLTAEQVIPTERFYAGGGTTVRGFKQDGLGPVDKAGDPLGGNAMLVLNNELRFPVASIFDGVGFVDIGNVFPRATDFKFSELRKTAGFGLRLRTPSLMLRFDYGFKLDKRPGESRGAFFFSIGQAF
jgi:outer membrane protein assembly complex protein YaeT